MQHVCQTACFIEIASLPFVLTAGSGLNDNGEFLAAGTGALHPSNQFNKDGTEITITSFDP